MISGLVFAPNDLASANSVVAISSRRPFQIVFHGHTEFAYPFLGCHLGQEDHLTFLGDPERPFKGEFLDCRADSPTFGERSVMSFRPDAARCLVIPAGVAHAFSGLENVYTVNNYRLLLPSPEDWMRLQTAWNVENDLKIVPFGTKEAPRYVANRFEAGDRFYELLAAHRRSTLGTKAPPSPMIENLRPHLVVKHSGESGILVIPDFGQAVILKAPLAAVRDACRWSPGARLAATFLPLNGDHAAIRVKSSPLVYSERAEVSCVNELLLEDGSDCEVESDDAFVVVREVRDRRHSANGWPPRSASRLI